MNYLAHGHRHLDDSWLLAGIAVPDWLKVLGRRLRVPGDRAVAHADHGDPHVAALARGVLRHHADDLAFHTSAAFHEAAGEVAEIVRPVRAAVPRARPSFIAHLLVEVLLDAEIVRRDPRVVDRYYGALATVEAGEVEAIVARMTPRPPVGLAGVVRRFVAARFVADYGEDARLVRRLDSVFGGIGQPVLGAALVAVVPAARTAVTRRADALLSTTL
jgi:hypothetical protein